MAKVELSVDLSRISDKTLLIDDLKKAVGTLATASDDQFQEIQGEKWFHRVWDLVTFSKDNEKRMAGQIKTLADAQKVLVSMLPALATHDEELAQWVREDTASIRRLQSNDEYLLERIKSLEEIAYGFQSSFSVDQLAIHEKRTLCACIKYLAAQFDIPSEHQQAYASALLRLLGLDLLTDNIEQAISAIKSDEARKCLLVCCLEYIYLFRLSENDLSSAIAEDIIYKLNIGPKTISEVKSLILEDVKLRGASGLVEKYRSIKAPVDTNTFTLDIDLGDPMPPADVPSCKEPCAVFTIEEIQACIKKYVNDKENSLGTLQYQSGEALSEKTGKLVNRLFPNAAPALKTVVAITKSKKSYLVFTTFALYYICGKEFLHIRYGEISPGTLGTTVEGDEPVFFCGTKKIPGSEVNIDALKNFCSEVSQITFKPDTDQLQPLSDLPFEVQIDYYSILSGVVGRTEGLHEVYRLVCDRKLEEYWNLFSEEQDTPIVQRIKDWKHTIPYPNEESTCAALLSDICRVLYITKNYGGHIGSGKEISTNNIVKEEETLFSYIVGDEAELGQIKNTAKMQVDAFINTISKYDPHSPERFEELNVTLRSYDRAATASKAAGLQSINQRLVVVDKKLRDKANVPILSVAYEQQVEHLIRKFLKEAKSLGKYTERFLTADREKMLKQMAPKGKVIQAEDTIGLYDPSIVNTIISTYSGILFAKDGFYYKDRLRVTWVPYAEIEAVKKGIGSLKITTRKEGAKRQTSLDLNGILFATSELEKLFSDIRVLYQG